LHPRDSSFRDGCFGWFRDGRFFSLAVVQRSMEYGTTVGRYVDRLADADGDRFAFAELALGEGDLPLDQIDPDRVEERLPDDVALTVHLPFRQPLATGVPEFDLAVREYLERALDAAAACGAEAAVCHATARNPTADDQREVLGEAVRDVVEAGRERDVTVHVENVGNLRAGVPLGTLASLAESTDVPLCFDLGHAVEEADEDGIESFLERVGDQVGYLHVHDVRARGDSHIPVGAGEIDFAWLGGLLREAGFDGRAAIEVFTDDVDLMRDSADRFERAFQWAASDPENRPAGDP
jgi:sugar phosphate isomerase/epimerase